MKERPILFSSPMVRAILEGRKTVTRRIVKPPRGYEMPSAPLDADDLASITTSCRYGQPGDRLWVRETWRGVVGINPPNEPLELGVARYVPDEEYCHRVEYKATQDADAEPWRPSIHMPRWASRITLEVTAVRVERLQDITHEQAIAEGVHVVSIGSGYRDRYSAAPVAWSDVVEGTAAAYEDARLAFRDLWDGINEARGFGWAANPWVWVVEFKRIEATA